MTPTAVSGGDLLGAHRDDADEYQSRGWALSNHLPMAVAALEAMGASRERIAAFAARYARDHALIPAGDEVRAARARWLRDITEHGAGATLRLALEQLSAGIGAAAFHPAIRAAYALERGDEFELAAALAYWERAFLALGVANGSRRVAADDALAALSAVTEPPPARGLIADRMASVAAEEAFAHVAAMVPPATGLPRLAIAAAAAFASSDGDFAALHVMTATHAFRTLARAAGDVAESAMPGFWRAYAAAAIVARTSRVSADDDRTALAPRSWDEMLPAACAHDDEHVIKAVYTAWCEGALGGPAHRLAAHRFLALHRA